MSFVIQKRNQSVELCHLTTSDRVESILRTGIKASEYGDFQATGDDGAGVYAVLPDKAAIRRVQDWLFFGDQNVTLVKFRYDGEYWECTEDDEEWDCAQSCEDASRVGQILIPGRKTVIAPENILSVTSL